MVDADEAGSPETRHPLIATALAVAAFLSIQFISGDFRFGQEGPGILDPDSYTRLLRIEHWLSGGHWYDPSAPWSNAPWGDTLHWGRLMDVLVAIPAVPLSHLWGLRPAILVAGSFLPILLGIATVVVLVRGARRDLAFGGIVLLGTLAALQPNLAFVFKLGYVDHHSLLIFFFTVGWAAAMALIRDDARGAAIAGGIAAGLGMWVSIESIVWIVAVIGTLAILWIAEGSEHLPRNASTMMESATITIALALVAERPPHDLLTVAGDRISIDHVVLVAAMAAAWIAISRTPLASWASTSRRRFIASATAFAFPVAIVGRIFPKFLRGPLADVDPRVLPLMFEHNDEVTHLSMANLRLASAAVVAVIPAVIATAWAIHRLRDGGRDQKRDATLALVLLAIYFPLTIWQWRWAPYLGIAVALECTLAVVALWRRRKRATTRWRAIGFGFLAVLLATVHFDTGVGLMLAAPPKHPTRECSCEGLGDVLAKDSGRDPGSLIIMTTQFEGPQIVYQAGTGVVGAPYHRNTAGLLDTNLVMAGHDDAASLRMLRTRGVGYVVICLTGKSVSFMNRAHPRGLAARLARGDVPDWLTPVVLPKGMDRGLRVYRVKMADDR